MTLLGHRLRDGKLRDWVSGLRLRQWTKNLLLFAGLLFAARLDDPASWLEAGAAFFAYCLASSAAYLLNDLHDAESDRLHPVKRHRPIASGAMSRREAMVGAGIMLVAALAIAAALGATSLGFLLVFVAIQHGYSLFLKRVAFLDVITIAGLFVLRASAGAEAIHVHISPWLLACTALLALFLAVAKRRAELLLGGSSAVRTRPSLARYSPALVDPTLVLLAAATLLAYSLYTFTAHDSLEMAIVLPLVYFAILRYLLLIRREGLGEEPERVLLTDVPILVSVAVWSVGSALILTL